MEEHLVPLNPANLIPADNPSSRAVAAYFSSLAPSGRRSMLVRLNKVAYLLKCPGAFLTDWRHLQYEHLVAIRQRMLDLDWKPSTTNTTLYAIRGVLRACFNLRLISADHLQRILQVKPVPFSHLLAGRELSKSEIQSLQQNCSLHTSMEIRDVALIWILYSCGLRRSELCSLDVKDVEQDHSGTWVLIRKAKGRKQRKIPVLGPAMLSLKQWLSIRGSEIEGALFVRIRRGGHIVRSSRLTPAGVYAILSRRGGLANVKRFSPHDLRRTCATHLLSKGVDISIVKKILGHADVNTTTRYDRRSDDAQIGAINSLFM